MKTWTQQKMLTATAVEVREHRETIRAVEADEVEGEGEFLFVPFHGKERMLREEYLQWVEMSLVAKESNENVNRLYESLLAVPKPVDLTDTAYEGLDRVPQDEMGDEPRRSGPRGDQ